MRFIAFYCIFMSVVIDPGKPLVQNFSPELKRKVGDLEKALQNRVFPVSQ